MKNTLIHSTALSAVRFKKMNHRIHPKQVKRHFGSFWKSIGKLRFLLGISMALSAFAGEPPLILQETGIYKYLTTRSISISDAGEFFIFNRNERTILHYASDGTPLENIGRPGSGPGEFSYPANMDLFGGKLYVQDMRVIHEFNEQGTFVRKLNLPNKVLSLTRVFNGWVGLSGAIQRSTDETTKLMWYSEEIDREITIAEWPSEAERNPGAKPAFQPGKHYFNPAKEYSRFILNHERDVAVVQLSGLDHLYGVDLRKQTQTFDIDVPGTRIPFDKEGAQKMFDHMKKRNEAMAPSIVVEPDFPDFFPVIRYIAVSPFNQLVVFKWYSGGFAQEKKTEAAEKSLLWYNFKGEQVPKVETDFKLSRVIKATDTYVYFTCYMDTEEWSVARVPRSEAASFLEANPLPSQESM